MGSTITSSHDQPFPLLVACKTFLYGILDNLVHFSGNTEPSNCIPWEDKLCESQDLCKLVGPGVMLVFYESVTSRLQSIIFSTVQPILSLGINQVVCNFPALFK